MTGVWQPIETYDKERGLDGYGWVLLSGRYEHDPCNSGKTWISTGQWNGEIWTQGYCELNQPTHWMPLPPPPTAS